MTKLLTKTFQHLAIGSLALLSGSLSAQEDPQNFSEAHQTIIIDAGKAAGILRGCGEEWKNFYLTFMAIEREKLSQAGFPTEQAIKRIGFMFGLSQAQTQSSIEKSPDRKSICSRDSIEYVHAQKNAMLQALENLKQ
jgi:hypothetical protein